MNLVIIEGHLGQDPDVKQTQNSTVANFSVATKERVKRGEEWEDHTEWHRVTVWGRSAENCGKYLTKGSRVLVKGCLRTRSYEKDGEKKYTTEIKADDVTFLSSKSEGAAPARGGERDRKPAPKRGRDDDDGGWVGGEEDPFK